MNNTARFGAIALRLACVCVLLAGSASFTCNDDDEVMRKRLRLLTALSALEGDRAAVTGVTLNKEATYMLAGGTERLYATVTPSYATNKNVTWGSDNESAAMVDSTGLVTGMAAGFATITATTVDGGLTALCEVAVSGTPVEVTGVTLEPEAASINVGETEQLAETIIPYNATNQNVTWESDNEAYATVSESGLVTGVGEGTATITVTTADGAYTDTCAVTVYPANTIADYRFAKESVLRAIPDSAIEAARNNLKIYYFHTSHGSRVITGMNGLMDYKSGDDTKFAFTSGGGPVSGSLYFQEAGYDLSAQEDTWDDTLRAYLETDPDINVVMGSWCDPGGHDHHSYIDRMEELIEDYPAITFVFMTGHPNGDGESTSDTSAYHCHTAVTEHCRTYNRFCIDYWSIETHGMDDTYYADADDNGVDGSTDFFEDWRDAHTLDTDYFSTGTCSSFDDCGCAHASQPITCNRIAYASWWIWARIAGWSGGI